VADLRSVEERVHRFELQLREWEETEDQVAVALEQATGRQTSLSALQAEIRTVYELVERTNRDAQAVTESQPRVVQARLELEEVLGRLREVESRTVSFDERWRQVAKAEERLAYVEAILDELRGAGENLMVNKAEINYMLEKFSALSLQAKQAESLIETLREERRLNERTVGALSEIRAHDRKGERNGKRSGSRNGKERQAPAVE
jgi:hypothetical protein